MQISNVAFERSFMDLAVANMQIKEMHLSPLWYIIYHLPSRSNQNFIFCILNGLLVKNISFCEKIIAVDGNFTILFEYLVQN